MVGPTVPTAELKKPASNINENIVKSSLLLNVKVNCKKVKSWEFFNFLCCQSWEYMHRVRKSWK